MTGWLTCTDIFVRILFLAGRWDSILRPLTRRADLMAEVRTPRRCWKSLGVIALYFLYELTFNTTWWTRVCMSPLIKSWTLHSSKFPWVARGALHSLWSSKSKSNQLLSGDFGLHPTYIVVLWVVFLIRSARMANYRVGDKVYVNSSVDNIHFSSVT